MNKRVHEIAKERGLTSKELLERLRAAGVEVKAASSNVDEAVALKVLGNGDGAAAATAAAQAPAAAEPTAKAAQPASDGGQAPTQPRPAAPVAAAPTSPPPAAPTAGASA